MKEIIIYADGGCRNNQAKNNIGGWGAVVEVRINGEREVYAELKDGKRNTTNNVMELTAATKALEYVKSETDADSVIVYMDSAYTIGCMTQWIDGWKRNSWRKSNKQPVLNVDQIKALDKACEAFDLVRPQFIKVKGHSDNVGNNLADKLANDAMDEVGASE